MSSFVSLTTAATTPYREGNLLVIPTGSSLPANCVKCGAPTADKLSRTFRWHTPWLYLLIVVGVIFYLIVALVVQKKARVDVPLCSVHRAWRKHMNWTGAILLLGVLPVSLVLEALGVYGGWIALTCVGMAFGGLAVLAIVGSSLAATYIDENVAKIRGASEEFLSTLPGSSA